MNKQKNMNASEHSSSETSQKELASGILKQAAYDLRRFHGATTQIERELYFDAYYWVISHDISWPFSFLNVCQLLGLESFALRDELLGDAAIGALGYWRRRCGRAARQLQSFLVRPFTYQFQESAAPTVNLAPVLD